MTKRMRTRIQAAETSFLRRVAGISLRDRVRSSPGGRAAAPSRQKGPAEVVRASDQDASCMPPFGGFPGTTNC